MERFLKFEEDISLEDLQKAQSDSDIIILRKSHTTNTVQIKVPEGMSSKKIKQAFRDYHIQKIYSDFPYPTKHEGLSKYFVLPFIRLFKKNI